MANVKHVRDFVSQIVYKQLNCTFLQALRPGSETLLDTASLEAIASDAPSATLPRSRVVDVLLADVMVAVGLQPSKGAVRR